MTQDNNFRISRSELKLITNGDFFIQKNAVTKKIISLLHELNNKIENVKNENKLNIPQDAFRISGKISKGENYLSLPYLVLDNPRAFSGKNIFAFRTMFWWGNYFSFTFHLSGKYLEEYRESVLKNFKKLKGKSFLICIHSEQWIHHLEKDNYVLSDTLDKKKFEKNIDSNKFIKFSRKLELKNWKMLADFGSETLKEYFLLIQS